MSRPSHSGYYAGIRPAETRAAAADCIVSAANAAAVRTLSGPARRWLPCVHCGYNQQPTGGKLTVTVDGTKVYELPITSSGPAPLDWLGLEAAAGAQMVITLAAGGAGVVAYLNTPGAE